MTDIKQTSKQWYRLYNRTTGLIIATFDGWGGDLKITFDKELLTQDEFLDKLSQSIYTKSE